MRQVSDYANWESRVIYNYLYYEIQGTLQLLKILFNELISLEIELLVMEHGADCMYGSVMMKEDKDQYIANFLNAMDQDFLSKFHQKMNSSASSSSSTDSNELSEEPKLKNMKLEAVQNDETNTRMVKMKKKYLLFEIE